MKSRPQRWAKACVDARAAIDDVQAALATLQSAIEDIGSIKDEYEDWQANLPEGLDQSPTADLLEAVVGLDLDIEVNEMAISEVETIIDEAEGIDLPRGFGRD